MSVNKSDFLSIFVGRRSYTAGNARILIYSKAKPKETKYSFHGTTTKTQQILFFSVWRSRRKNTPEKKLKSFSKLINKESPIERAIYWCRNECDQSAANSFLFFLIPSNGKIQCKQVAVVDGPFGYGNHSVVIYYSSFGNLKGLHIFLCFVSKTT